MLHFVRIKEKRKDVAARLIQEKLAQASLGFKVTSTTGDEAFAPTLDDFQVFLEYQEDSKADEPPSWSRVQFTLLGLIDPKVRYIKLCVMYIQLNPYRSGCTPGLC